MNSRLENFSQRPAWIEINLGQLQRNVQLIRADLPPRVKLMAVVKDEAYGHGALDVARIALAEGAWGCGLSTLEEAMVLRERASPRRYYCSANDRRANSNGA